MKKALIFDLDGTLLDSMQIWDNIGYEYLSAKGVLGIPSDIKEILKAMNLMEAATYFFEQFGIGSSAKGVYDEIEQEVARKYLEQVALKSGTAEFLEQHRELKMCVATATDQHLASLALKRLGILEYFSFILTSSEVGISKENPDIFLMAAKRLEAPVEDCIVFEDALHAIKAAKSAGFYTVGLYEPCFAKDSEEIKAYADCYVRNLNEVVL